MSTPTKPCPTILRDGPCAMPNEHRGRHTTVAFCCDLCSQYRRGQSITIAYDTADDCAACGFPLDGVYLTPRGTYGAGPRMHPGCAGS